MLPMVRKSQVTALRNRLLNAISGELGLGPDEPKSATKPTRHQPLLGIEVFR